MPAGNQYAFETLLVAPAENDFVPGAANDGALYVPADDDTIEIVGDDNVIEIEV